MNLEDFGSFLSFGLLTECWQSALFLAFCCCSFIGLCWNLCLALRSLVKLKMIFCIPPSPPPHTHTSGQRTRWAMLRNSWLWVPWVTPAVSLSPSPSTDQTNRSVQEHPTAATDFFVWVQIRCCWRKKITQKVGALQHTPSFIPPSGGHSIFLALVSSGQ